MSIEISIFDDLLKKNIIPDSSQKKLINIFDHFYSKEKKFFSKFLKNQIFYISMVMLEEVKLF